jgi:hypothetical protein
MRLLLIQICTVLSFAGFSQKVAPNNKVLIENFPSATTYSIQLKYTNGTITPLGSSKVYIAAMFPQLDKLKMVKDSGDIVVTIVPGDEIDLSVIRQRKEFATMLANYERLKPLPVHVKSESLSYFQPLNIVFQNNERTFYTLVSIGELHSRPSDKNTGTDRISREKADALSSLHFMRANIFELSGKNDQ